MYLKSSKIQYVLYFIPVFPAVKKCYPIYYPILDLRT